MKSLKIYIQEAFKLGDDNFKIKNKHYKYFPKDKDELQKILKERLEKLGKNQNEDLNDIDVSKITDMSDIFNLSIDLRNININVSDWNVSNVKNMKRMFYNLQIFDCDLSAWDISSVENMNNMFYNCVNFKGKGLEKWDMLNVTDIDEAFWDCENFDADVSSWNISKIKSFYQTFHGCKKFKGIGLDKWDVSNVDFMGIMLCDCENLDPNLNLGGWDVSNITNMRWLFGGCKKFKGIGLDKWNVSNVTNMEGMFKGCYKFNADISNWNVSKVEDMESMFETCRSFDQDLGKWKLDKIITMSKMFKSCKSYTGKGLENWNMEKIKFWNMQKVFDKCPNVKIPDWYDPTGKIKSHR